MPKFICGLNEPALGLEREHRARTLGTRPLGAPVHSEARPAQEARGTGDLRRRIRIDSRIRGKWRGTDGTGVGC